MVFWAWLSTQAMFLGRGLQNSLPHYSVCIFPDNIFSTQSYVSLCLGKPWLDCANDSLCNVVATLLLTAFGESAILSLGSSLLQDQQPSYPPAVAVSFRFCCYAPTGTRPDC